MHGYTRGNIHWRLVAYFAILHGIGMYGFYYASAYASPGLIAAMVAYFFLCHLSITIGAHRYFTHRAFTAPRWFAYLLATLFSGVVQGSEKVWILIHTQHHANADGAKDPHSPYYFCVGRPPEEHTWQRLSLGVLHAQLGWAILKSSYRVDPEYLRVFKQRLDHPALRWQRRHHWVLAVTMTIGISLALGFLFNDPLGGLVLGATRLLVQYHATWVVNSLGHFVGEQSDSKATNFALVLGVFGKTILNLVLAIITVGEVWHANHHEAERHWQLGRKWWQIDPGAFVIRVLSWAGVVRNLRAPPKRLFNPASYQPSS